MDLGLYLLMPCELVFCRCHCLQDLGKSITASTFLEYLWYLQKALSLHPGAQELSHLCLNPWHHLCLSQGVWSSLYPCHLDWQLLTNLSVTGADSVGPKDTYPSKPMSTSNQISTTVNCCSLDCWRLFLSSL